MSSAAPNSLEPDRTTQLHLWLTPNQYYVDAGLGAVPISVTHGCCEVCYDEIGSVVHPPGSFKDGIPAKGKAAGAARSILEEAARQEALRIAEEVARNVAQEVS